VIIRMVQDDVDLGVMNDCALCPVARALGRHGFTDVSVGDVTIYAAGPGDRRRCYLTPPGVANFIHDFDDGEDVSPIEFELTEVAS
jgi:hypothetical protein